jgi:Ca2+-binding EF-hand superfamily protein
MGRFAQTLRVNLLDEFQSVDKMRRGRVSQAQWWSVIALFGGRLPEAELQAVFNAYLVDGRFDYGSFCRDAAEPVQTSEGGSAEFDEALKRCKALLATKMITIDVLFRRYDPSRSGFVPSSAVAKAFCDYGLVLSPEVIGAIRIAFGDQRSSDRVNYLDLGKRIDAVELTRDEYQSTLFKQSLQEQHEVVLAGAMNELRQKLRVRPRSWRRLSANVRHETISEADLIAALDDAGVVMKKEQIEAVIRCYRVPQTREIDFIRFSQDIENTNPIRGL